VDDDPLIGDLIKHFCSKQEWIENCVSVMDGSQALQALNADQYDLIFLDFNLPDLNGKSLLGLFPSTIPVIMVTTEESFGAESYNYEQVIDFLVKPIKYERFLKAILRLQQTSTSTPSPATLTRESQQKMIVKDGNDKVLIRPEEIQYVKSEANYVVFYLPNKKVMSLMSMKQLELDLPEQFMRVHKSYLINKDLLESIGTDHVVINSMQIPIGPKYRDDIADLLKGWQSL
jgi:DNA-binding LytR/AlgR family response regulator